MKKYFECQCHSPEHTLKFVYDSENKELYSEIFLNQYRNFFKRSWVAIKYIFGYKCKYGHFDCFIFKNDDIVKFKNLLEKIKC